MMKRKSMKLFLVLGVVLLSLLASGCTPNPETKPSETEPGLNTVAFQELVDTEIVSELHVYTMVLSTPRVVNREEELASFFEVNLENAPFIKAADASDILEEIMDISHIGGQLKLYFLDAEGGTVASLYVNDDGAALLTIGDEQYVTPKSQPLSYENIGASIGWTSGKGGT